MLQLEKEIEEAFSTPPENAPSQTDVVREDILFIAQAQRDNRRVAGAFSTLGWIGLYELSRNKSVPAGERDMARTLLDRYELGTAALVESLPALERPDGSPIDHKAIDRFKLFVDFPIFRNLDLARREHKDGAWEPAETVEHELRVLKEHLESVKWLNPLTGMVEPRFEVVAEASTPENCGMHIQVMSGEALSRGLLYLGRNTKKLMVLDRMTGEDFHVNKRTEFVIDINKFAPRVKVEISKWLIAGYSPMSTKTTRLLGALFEWMDGLLTDRHDAIAPVHTRLFVYRNGNSLSTPLVEPGELEDCPRVAKIVLNAYDGD